MKRKALLTIGNVREDQGKLGAAMEVYRAATAAALRFLMITTAPRYPPQVTEAES